MFAPPSSYPAELRTVAPLTLCNLCAKGLGNTSACNGMVTPASPGLVFKLMIIRDALQSFTDLLQYLMLMHAAGSALQMQISLAAVHNDSVLEME